MLQDEQNVQNITKSCKYKVMLHLQHYYLITVYLITVYLITVYLITVYLITVYLITVYLITVYLSSVLAYIYNRQNYFAKRLF